MRFNTPFGPAWAAADENGALTAFTFAADAPHDGPVDAAIARQIEDFFAGRSTGFDVRLAPEGTDFQKRVWAELRRIPFGETISYAELARRIGRPGAARAVGRANATNPIAVIVPCHRVIGADGSLTGYAGGIDLEQQLLAWERGRAGLFAAAS
jgi:methylated-DNA-[protein]-cysteine S-methyltransferase